MPQFTKENDFIIFADEDDSEIRQQTGGEESESLDTPPWKVIIVDDEQSVHTVTKMVLDDFTYNGRGLHFFSAYSAQEATVILEQNPDIAVALLDVVMETEDAGLCLVRTIREELGLAHMRIVLRTGQPGQAPEPNVILRYDVNDYKSKTELTEPKLFTMMMAELRSYENLVKIDEGKKSLEEANRTLEERVAARTKQLAENERKLLAILDAAVYPIVIATMDEGEIRFLNARAISLFGLTNETGDMPNAADFFQTEADYKAVVTKLGHQQRIDDMELCLKDNNGRSFWVLLSSAVMVFEEIECLLFSFNDITERRQMEEDLRRLATTDPLTGIHNRRYFVEQAERELQRAMRHGNPLSLLIMDIDHFKNVNDTYGHSVGDKVLCEITRCCHKVVRDIDYFARLGGEEFGILLPQTDEKAAEEVAERVRQSVEELQIKEDGQDINVTISVGYSLLCEEDKEKFDPLFARADNALYKAKRNGRNQVAKS